MHGTTRNAQMLQVVGLHAIAQNHCMFATTYVFGIQREPLSNSFTLQVLQRCNTFPLQCKMWKHAIPGLLYETCETHNHDDILLLHMWQVKKLQAPRQCTSGVACIDFPMKAGTAAKIIPFQTTD